MNDTIPDSLGTLHNSRICFDDKRTLRGVRHAVVSGTCEAQAPITPHGTDGQPAAGARGRLHAHPDGAVLGV